MGHKGPIPKFDWDPSKAERNLRERGIPFSAAYDFQIDTAITAVDDRQDYGEIRYRSFGYIEDRLHCLVFTLRGDTIRIISLRKANSSEVRAYDEQANAGRSRAG